MATATKRKRDSQDMPGMRPAPGMHQDFDTSSYLQGDDGTMDSNENNMDFTLLAQHNADGGEDVDIQQHTQLQNQQSHHRNQHDPQHQHQQHNQQQDISDSSNNQNNNSGQSATDTATAALAQYHTMTVPQPTEHSFMQTAGGGDSGEGQGSSGGDGDLQRTNSYDGGQFTLSEAIKDAENRVQSNGAAAGESSPPSASKPAVGSEEWHKVRRDNHKEVERRRRETINEGINELAKIVPGCEKNKGSILSRAVQFIQQLKENETQNIEKWTLEKLLTEQAIAELSSSCDKLKAECQRAWAEAEHWKLRAGEAGVDVEGEGGKVEGAGMGGMSSQGGGGGGGFAGLPGLAGEAGEEGD